jgi:hypothetical protein
MTLKISTARALHSYNDLRDLVRAVEGATAEDESEWIEWKSELDLGAKETSFMLARTIIGMANRRVDEAARYAEGFGYILVGVEPGNRCGIEAVDLADLDARIEPYLGPEGPRWTARYDTIDGPPVLIIIVDPPRNGHPIYSLHKEFSNGKTRHKAGEIFVRKLARTVSPGPGDHLYLARRMAAGTTSPAIRNRTADRKPGENGKPNRPRERGRSATGRRPEESGKQNKDQAPQLVHAPAGEYVDEPAKTLGASAASEAIAISADEFARRFGRDSQQAQEVLSLLRGDKSPDTLKPYSEWFKEAFPDTRGPQRDAAAGTRVPAAQNTPPPNRASEADPPTASVRNNVTSPPLPRLRPASSPLPTQPVTPAPRVAFHPGTRWATGVSGPIRGSVFSGDGAPSTVLTAVWLMYAGAAASLVTTVVSLRVTSSQWWSDYPVSIIVWILLARASRNGWEPARAVGSVLFGIATLLLFGAATSPQSGIATICDVVVWLAGLGAVICLWRPASTAFFLGLRENRRLPPGGPYGRYGPW